MRLLFITILLLLVACTKNDIDLSQVQNLNNNQITALGHAGMGIASQFPINTFESIKSAISLGADGVEVDVQMTKDSVLILYHDATLQEQTDLEGMIFEHDWNYIQQAIYKNPPFAEYRIVSLDQLFENLDNKQDLLFSLDFKFHESDHPDEYILRYWNALIQVLEKHQMSENVFVETRRKSHLEKLKSIRPDLKIFFLETFDKGFEYAKSMNLFGMVMPNGAITKEQVQEAHDAGLRINLFDLQRKEDNLDAIKKNPDYLETDKVKHLIKVLK